MRSTRNEPLLLHTTMRITEGHLDDFTYAVAAAVTFVERHGPQLMVQVFVDEQNMIAHSFQLYADSAAIHRHRQLSDPHIQNVMRHCTVERLTMYGRPDRSVAEALARGGADLPTCTTLPRHIGFLRMPSEADGALGAGPDLENTTRPPVSLRPMTSLEYATYSNDVQSEVVRELRATMSEQDARAHAARGVAQHLPEGLATPHHRLLIAEDAAGTPIGNAWIGPDPYRGEASNGAWLYDINVYSNARGRGYGSAILTEVEALVVGAGRSRLGLNVFGGNAAAIALYRSSGYTVTTQEMSKQLR